MTANANYIKLGCRRGRFITTIDQHLHISGTNPYEVLGLTPGAEEEVVKAVYQSLVKKHHPDQGGDKERFKEIRRAYERIQSGDYAGGEGEKEASHNEADIGSIFSIFNTPVETEVVAGQLSDGLVIEGDQLTIGLINIVRADISDYVPDSEESWTKNRLIIMSHVSNPTDYRQQFKYSKFKIISERGHEYDMEKGAPGMHIEGIFTDSKSLPSQVYNENRDMEPHTTANFVSVVKQIPENVKIDRVVFPSRHYAEHRTSGVIESKTRYVFDIQPEHWEDFNRVVSGGLNGSPTGEFGDSSA